jgi:hypothetical protein
MRAINRGTTFRAVNRSLIKRQSRIKNSQLAPQGGARYFGETVQFFPGVKVATLDGGYLPQIDVPLAVFAVIGSWEIELVWLSIFASSLLHYAATVRQLTDRCGQPRAPSSALVPLNLFNFAAVAQQHDRFELERPSQAVPWLWLYRLLVFRGKQISHPLLFCAWAEELERESGIGERNLQKHVPLFENISGRQIKFVQLNQSTSFSSVGHSTSLDADRRCFALSACDCDLRLTAWVFDPRGRERGSGSERRTDAVAGLRRLSWERACLMLGIVDDPLPILQDDRRARFVASNVSIVGEVPTFIGRRAPRCQ